MSALNDKIISYPVESLLQFDEPYAIPPTQQGTINDTASFWSLTGRQPVYESTVSPGGEGGSWKFFSNSTNGCRFRNQGSITSRINDQNYSVGAWVKIPALPTDNNAKPPIITHQPYTTGGYLFTIGRNPGDGNWYPGMDFHNLVNIYTGVDPVNAGDWIYYAARRSGTTFEVYINGTLVQTITNYSGTSNGSTLNFGQIYQGYDFTQNISNYYIGTYSSVDATAIAEIWAAGQPPVPVNVNFSASAATASALSVLPTISTSTNEVVVPATASALQTEPTVAVTTGDHTEITTSIPVSALMAPATVSTQTFTNIFIDGAGTATAELINNIIAGGSNSVDFGAQEFLASAEVIEPFVSRAAMIASAESGNHTVYVTPSYYSLVKSKNPLFYFNFDSSTPTNFGSWQNVTYTLPSTLDLYRSEPSGGDMQLVGAGRSWKFLDINPAVSDFYINLENQADTLYNLCHIDRSFTLEFWVKEGATLSFGNLTLTTTSFSVRTLARPLYNSVSSTTFSFSAQAQSFLKNDDWNHVVLVASPRTATGVDYYGYENQGISYGLYLNGVFLGSGAVNLAGNYSSAVNYDFGFSANQNTFIDETAVYPDTLSTSSILDNYNFINNLDPNRNIFAEPMVSTAQSGNHQFAVTSNADPEIKEATASALLTTPTLIAGTSVTNTASVMTASALSVMPEASYGITHLATPNIAYAESVNAFALNTIYFDYVQANILPYRYVTFDGASTLVDYGSDNDYSVQPTILGGTVVNPDEGINGKSAKTAGTSYVTDGVILKESEWNDTWGTGQFNYHSSFWMEKTPEDNSTGLRVLWNLNGYLDNQHVILFHYQNKLHMQFNNGSGTHLDFVTTNNIDLFDGQRHFVVVAFDHTNNNNNIVNLYIDSVLVLTCALGSYTGQTVNGTTFVGPNDEANNHPRLGVGCLITPFGSTALPVVPTNTKLYLDEIIWAKTAIDQTGVTALYNIMPDKNNSDFAAETMIASAEIAESSISTEVVFVSEPVAASALINDVTIIADRNIVVAVEPATASVEMLEALRIDNVVITSDIMVATAIFNDAGVKITLSGGPMLANVSILKPFGTHNGELKVLSPYMRYIRTEALNGIAIYSMKEIK